MKPLSQGEWLTEDFNFDLPPELIAQMPISPRDAARLLHVTPRRLGEHHIYDLPDVLRAGDVMVLNDTRVMPARLYGQRGAVRLELLLHKKQENGHWLAFARPAKRLHSGDRVEFGEDFSAEILEKRDGGDVLLSFSASDQALPEFLARYGEPPLPPYIKRRPGEAKKDQELYQTVYAAKDGAIAAPTAGLHLTHELLAKLDAKDIARHTVTLHVGAGTFLPVKTERVKDHVMHAEWGEVGEATAQALNEAKSQGRRIVAVGTTALRVLESAVDADGTIRPFRGETSIFITPGYDFRAVDVLMTNYHLPKSTLFMLVCAFMGPDRMREIYAHAMAQGYRFYSYGDATLLERA